MDGDYTNCSPETQMDLMAMMIEMEKLNELCEPLPSLELCSGPMPTICNATTTTTTNTTPPPLLAGLPSSLSFSNFPAQDTMLHQMFSVPPAGTELSFAGCEQRRASMAAMREMIFRIAAMQPVHIDPESVKPPKRRNVRISKDPQSVAARHRRERISERIRILQRLVPGGTKMDTASMLDEAIHYVKFLKNQVQSLERAAAGRSPMAAAFFHATGFSNGSYSCQGFVNPTQM